MLTIVNIMFILLTRSIALYMYSPITPSFYIFLYDTFSSGASIPCSLARHFRIPFLTLQFTTNVIQLSSTLQPTMHRQGLLPATHSDGQADLLTSQKTSFKCHSFLHNSLCNSKADNQLLNYVDASLRS